MRLIKNLFLGIGRILDFTRYFLINALFLLVLVIIVVAIMNQPGRATLPTDALMVWQPEGQIVEMLEQPDPLSVVLASEGPAPETRLRDLIDALDHGASDPNVALLLLKLDRLQYADPAKLDALGEALRRFRASGKAVIASSDSFSQSQYYLASFADQIYMHPMGQVILGGYAMHGTYFKDALEKLAINVHVFRVGTYKAAVEPFLRNDMSDAAREANRTLIDGLWTSYRDQIAENRKLDPNEIDNFVNDFDQALLTTGGDMARLALESKLVDELLTRDQLAARVRQAMGLADEADIPQFTHGQFLAARIAPNLPGAVSMDGVPRVAVIHARGTILPGEQPPSLIGADSLNALIRQVRKNERFAALVLRVDSPGGSAFASELIREELELTQLAGKPVVVSMSGTAASGGYWIAATADEIWAAPTTITGSIGIFGMLPTFEQTLANWGVYSDGVETSQISASLNPTRSLSEPMQRVLQASTEQGYERFINLVGRGRDMSPEAVDQIAQGRIWSGQAALELGLVDQLGHLDGAVAAAAELADLENWELEHVSQPLSPQELFLRQIMQHTGVSALVKEMSATAELLPLHRIYKEIKQLNDPSNLYALCQSCRLSL